MVSDIPSKDETWGHNNYKCTVVRIIYNFSLSTGSTIDLVEYTDYADYPGEDVDTLVMDLPEFTRRYRLLDLG